MTDWLDLTNEEARQLSTWIMTYAAPGSVLLLGEKDSPLAQQINLQGIAMETLTAADFAGSGTVQDRAFDVILLAEDALASFGQVPAAELARRLERAKHLLVIFSLNANKPYIPAASSLLWECGYRRDFSVEKWLNDHLLVYSYSRQNDPSTLVIEAYEAEVWRQAQISQKRRLLLNDFRNEIYKEVSTASRIAMEKDREIRERDRSVHELTQSVREKNQVIQDQTWLIKDWQHRWDAFQNSRTGRAIQAFHRGRQLLIPSGSRREGFLRFGVQAARVVRNEGLARFLKAMPFRMRKRARWQMAKMELRYTSDSADTRVVDIAPVSTRQGGSAHTQAVDVIICVHNALEDVKRCLASLQEHTPSPYRLILVDDGSGPETAAFLAEFAAAHAVTLLRSDEATGYTRAANRGLRESKGDFAVLLNSDTILTPGWLDRMVGCALSDPKIGIVGPLSNTASWQSVPKIEDNGDWAENPLPEGVNAAIMGGLVAGSSAVLYPQMPLLNGFCLMIRRELINEIGIFDEENFGAGYGEEDDYTLRARKAGWQLALADDTYIFHAQSKSYSSERRKMLSERAGKILATKHGTEMIQEGVAFCHHNRVLEGIRARSAAALMRYQDIEEGKRHAGKRVLFILPVASPGGGANVIRSESLALMKMGVEVDFFNLRNNRAAFSASYPQLEIPTIYGEIEDIPSLARKYDAVIATYNPSVGWMEPIERLRGLPVRGYYIQGFEPLMYPPDSYDYQRALGSYSLLPDLVRFTKTDWTREMVQNNTGQDSHIVGVSLDIDLYRPRPRSDQDWPFRPLRIAAMIRPEAPYREPYKTMQLLKKAADVFGNQVEAWIFGTTQDNPDFLAMPRNFPWKLYGVLSQEKVANLLNQVDIFVDYSSHQAMGLTALEAMSSGCAVIVPSHGGATSFAHHEQNSLVVDTASFDCVWDGLKRMVEDQGLREKIQRNAIYDVCSYFPERAARNILKVLFEDR